MTMLRSLELWLDCWMDRLNRPRWAGATAGAALILCLAVWSGDYLWHGVDPDLFARTAVGQLISDRGSVPLHDPFAYTPKNTNWIDHEWLAGVIFHWVALNLGGWGLQGLAWIFGILTVSMLAQAQSLRFPESRTRLPWLLLCTLSASFVWLAVVRAQIFTYLFLAVYLRAFVDLQQQRRTGRLWILPLVMLVWVNTHGGFVVGLGLHLLLLLSWLIGRKPQWFQVLGSWLLSLAATLVNPYPGLSFWRYILEAAFKPRPNIVEWQALSVLDPGHAMQVLMIGIVAVGLLRNWRKTPLAELLFLAVSGYFGIRHIRLLAVFSFVACVYGDLYFEQAWQWLQSVRPALAAKSARCTVITLAFLIAAGVAQVALRGLRNGFAVTYKRYPVCALEWLKTSAAGGRVLIDFNEGSFALWQLYPRFLISMDGRYEEVYPESTFQDVERALYKGESDWKDAFKKVSPDFIVLNKEYGQFINWQSYGPEWCLGYEDSQYAVLNKWQCETKKTARDWCSDEKYRKIIGEIWTPRRWKMRTAQ